MLRLARKLSNIIARNFSSSSQDHEMEMLAFHRFYESSRVFFSRREEMDNLIAKLRSDEKGIFLLTGPPNCGKTRLVKEILKDLNQFLPISYNMRTTKVQGNKHDSLIARLASSFNRHLTLLQAVKNAYNAQNSSSKTYFGLNLNDSIPWIENINSYLKVTPKMDPNEISGAKFDKIFGNAIDNFYKFIFTSSKINLVLFIDEFNNAKDEEDQRFKKSFLQYLVRKSKEENKLSVIFATWDSLLINYLNDHCDLRNGVIEELYLGWLSKEETFNYLTLRKVPERFHEMVYEFHGGNILEINHLLRDGDEKITEDQILEYRNARLSIDIPYISSIQNLADDEEKALIAIYEKLIKQDYELRINLDYEFDKKLIEKLIKNSLLYSQRGIGLRERERTVKSEVITLNAPSHKFAVEEYLRLHKLCKKA